MYAVSQAVREVDLSSDGAFLNSVGKVVGEHVKVSNISIKDTNASDSVPFRRSRLESQRDLRRLR